MRLRVRFAETDQLGVAHHSSYVIWLEAARIEWLRERGLSYRELEESGLSLMVSNLNVEYRQSTRFDDEIDLEVTLQELRSRQLAIGYRLRRRLLATATTTHIAADRTGKAVRIPADWLAAMLASC
ncbi:MAG: acyl-CoA thioesterase [Truepera sp.]|nr:acyl-CoA thioesterase [Truepera sp.]